MTSLRVFGLTVSALALLAAPAHAAAKYIHEGPYVGLGAGVTIPMEDEIESKTGLPPHKLSFDPGPAVHGQAGYAWGNGLRTELELGYSMADFDKSTNPFGNPALGASGDYSVFNAMANLFYDMDINWFLTPYVGLGVGYGHIWGNGLTVAGSPTTSVGATDGDAGNFAYQAIGGFSYEFAGHWAATLDYRYLSTLNVDFGNMKSEYSSHNILAGIRYHFDAPTPPAPPPAPAPVAPVPVAQPIAPAIANTYMVFFDFDKSTLTPEAKNILASVAADYKKGKHVSVNVTGHADRAGKDTYNQKLSERRAKSVKAELIRLGLPTGGIATKGLGETTPLVQTADGVREAQNRRAEIVLDAGQ
ncbi:MAG: OmpA family protein [Alphaproteobacteria bacterium]